MVRSLFRTAALGGLLLAFGVASAQGLNIGDPAPALRPAKWLKGTPVKAFEPGKVYVVEFWATWCGPCKENIPHLTELAKKYRGKVSVTGVSIWESTDPESTAYLKKVESFVKGQGGKMDYNVAVDGPESTIGNGWMKAAGEGGIPCTFVIGKDGKIAWIGHPQKLDEVLQQVLANKFDSAAARTARLQDVRRRIADAMNRSAWSEALTLIDSAVAAQPDSAPAYTYDRLVALFHSDPKAATTLSDSIIKESEGNIGAYRMIVSIFATYKDLRPEDYRYALKLDADALAKKEMGYMFLAMRSEIQSSLGDREAAIRSQEEAVKAAETDSHAPKEFVEMLRKKLEKLKAG